MQKKLRTLARRQEDAACCRDIIAEELTNTRAIEQSCREELENAETAVKEWSKIGHMVQKMKSVPPTNWLDFNAEVMTSRRADHARLSDNHSQLKEVITSLEAGLAFAQSVLKHRKGKRELAQREGQQTLNEAQKMYDLWRERLEALKSIAL